MLEVTLVDQVVLQKQVAVVAQELQELQESQRHQMELGEPELITGQEIQH
jgi:hypothetical protein